MGARKREGLRLEWRTPEELDDNPQNWRTHPEHQVAALSEVMDDVGWAGACLYNDRTGRLIDGHARKQLAISRGEKKVPVLIGDWSEADEQKILVTLDPIAGMAATDKKQLDSLLRSIESDGQATAVLLHDLAKANKIDWDEVLKANPKISGVANQQVIEDEAPEPRDQSCVSLGDLWLLGDHRLICGDSTDAATVGRVMNGERAKLCNTDPPYGIAYTDETRVAADREHARQQRESKWESGIENDGIDGEKLQAFLEAVIRTAVPHLDDHAAYYLWHPMLTQGTFFAAAAAAAADILIHRQIIWAKPSLLFGFGDYHWQHELCFYGWRKGFRPEFYGERNQTTLWQLKHEVSNGNRVHPTQKPVELFARPILNHLVEGEICYEPFAGSGSQIIAAEQLKRRCYAVELEPRYVAQCIERFQKLTGKQAIREDGVLYDDLISSAKAGLTPASEIA